MRRFLALVLAALALPALAAVTPLPGAASQRAPARTAFPNPIAVRVTDDAGKPVVNAQLFLYQGQRRVDYYGDKWQEKEILKDMRSLRAQKP